MRAIAREAFSFKKRQSQETESTQKGFIQADMEERAVNKQELQKQFKYKGPHSSSAEVPIEKVEFWAIIA